jgi:predicted DNA-binding transcriptional regulator AlpA
MATALHPSDSPPTPPPDGLPSSPLLTRADLARLFRTSVWTIQQWEKSGRLPRPVRLGRASLWPQDQIAAVIRGGTVAQAPAPHQEREAVAC